MVAVVAVVANAAQVILNVVYFTLSVMFAMLLKCIPGLQLWNLRGLACARQSPFFASFGDEGRSMWQKTQQRRGWEFWFMMSLGLLLLASDPLSLFLAFHFGLFLMSVVFPLVLLKALRQVPRNFKNLEDTFESWLAFGPPVICLYSFCSMKRLYDSNSSSWTPTAWGSDAALDQSLLDSSHRPSQLLYLCCLIGLFCIYGSLILFFVHCRKAVKRDPSWYEGLSINASQVDIASCWPQALLWSLSMALTSLLFSTGTILFRWSLVLEYLVR